jgi:hypothetical protein
MQRKQGEPERDDNCKLPHGVFAEVSISASFRSGLARFYYLTSVNSSSGCLALHFGSLVLVGSPRQPTALRCPVRVPPAKRQARVIVVGYRFAGSASVHAHMRARLLSYWLYVKGPCYTQITLSKLRRRNTSNPFVFWHSQLAFPIVGFPPRVRHAQPTTHPSHEPLSRVALCSPAGRRRCLRASSAPRKRPGRTRRTPPRPAGHRRPPPAAAAAARTAAHSPSVRPPAAVPRRRSPVQNIRCQLSTTLAPGSLGRVPSTLSTTEHTRPQRLPPPRRVGAREPPRAPRPLIRGR